MGGMTDLDLPPILDDDVNRFVAALIMWGATASQIVSHMEASGSSGRSTATASTVEIFHRLVLSVLDPDMDGRHDHAFLARAGTLVEAVVRAVGEEILLVDTSLTGNPSRPARGHGAPAQNRAERRCRGPRHRPGRG